MANGYVGKWTKFGTCVILKAETAELPHIQFTYWDGGGYRCGEIPVLSGQTPEDAANASAYSKYDHFSWYPIELLNDCPSDSEIRIAKMRAQYSRAG